MDFRILGPLEAWDDGRALELGAGRQRALLMLLLVHAGEVVSADRLIDDFWAENPPASAAKVLQGYISQLRRALPVETIVTRGSGYVIRADATDAGEFERLLGASRNQPPREAAATLRTALALWRGPPLADVAYEAWAQGEIVRLEELRLVALEERIDADLALGDSARLVPELEALVAEHPLRERLQAQLMLALYRSGRQAEALERYRDAREALSRELGLEPGPALQELERRILQQDPALAPPPVADKVAAAVPQSLRRRGPALVVAGALLVAAAAAAAAAFELTRSSGQPQEPTDAVAVVDAASGRPVTRIPVGNTPTSVAAGLGRVWVLNADDETVSQIDPVTNRVVKTFASGGTPTDIAVGRGAVWIGNGAPSAGSQLGGGVFMSDVARIDRDTGVVTHRTELTGVANVDSPPRIPGASELAVGDGAVWAIDPNEKVERIDPASGRRLATVGGVSAVAVAAGPDGVWVDDGVRTVARIDTRSNTIAATIPLTASALSGIAVGAGAVWVADSIDGTLWRIEPGPPAVTRTIPVGVGATGVTFGEGAVWVVNWLHGSVLRIDPRSNTVTRTITLAGTPQAVAVSSGRAWVSVDEGFGTPTGATPRLASGTEPLPSSLCGPVAYDGLSKVQYLIASDLPLQGPTRASTLPMTDAIQYVLREHHFRAGRYTVGYQSCDDSTAQAGVSDDAKCRENTEALARNTNLLGVIGPYFSSCAEIEIPIADKADLAMISTINTEAGLTHGGPGTLRGQPGVYYPTGQRNYVRLEPPDDVQGAAYALFAGSLGLRRVYLLDEVDDPYGRLLVAGFMRAARAAHVTIAGVSPWDDLTAKSYPSLAERIAHAHVDGVLLGGYASTSTRALIADIRRRVGPSVTIFAPDGFTTIPLLRTLAGPEAQGLYVSFAGEPDQSLPPAGQRFLRTFAATQPGGVVLSYGAVYAAEATEVLLDAIARSDGTRASVTRALLRTRIENGLLGSFHFDANGDIAPAPVTIFRVIAGRQRSSTLVEDFDGSTVTRVVAVPADLLAAPSG